MDAEDTALLTSGLDHSEDLYIWPRTVLRLGFLVDPTVIPDRGLSEEISLYASQVLGVVRAADVQECAAPNGVQSGHFDIFTRRPCPDASSQEVTIVEPTTSRRPGQVNVWMCFCGSDHNGQLG
jgi:hypothetical protein